MRVASKNSCLWSFSVFTIDGHQVEKVEKDIERVTVDLRDDDEDDNNDDDDNENEDDVDNVVDNEEDIERVSRLTFALNVDNEVDKKGDISDNDNDYDNNHAQLPNTMMVDSFTIAFTFSRR